MKTPVDRRRDPASARLGLVSRWSLVIGMALAGLAAGSTHHSRGAPAPFHFSVEPGSASAVAGRPFDVAVTARDGSGSPRSDVTGSLALHAEVERPPTGFLVSEVSPSDGWALELVNVAREPADLGGWRLAVYLPNSDRDLPYEYYTVPGPAICPPSATVVLRPDPKPQGAVSLFPPDRLFPPFLAPGYAVVLLDPAGRVADALAIGSSSSFSRVTFPAPISADAWSGATAPLPPFPGTTSLQRIGRSRHGNRTDWSLASPTLGEVNPGCHLPFAADSSPIPISPERIDLVDGRWQGAVTFLESATRAVLRVDDEAGHTGAVAPLEVRPAPAPILAVPARWSETQAGVSNVLLTLPETPESDLVVRLESSDPAEIAVPPSVTIPAGTARATVPLQRVDDPDLDGSQEVVLVVSAPGYGEARFVVIADDDESEILRLALPNRLLKELAAFPASGEVSVVRPVAKDVTVELATDRPDLLRLPRRVVLPAGDTRATFSVDPINDHLLTGEAVVEVTATVAHWVASRASVPLGDRFGRHLFLTTSSPVREGIGSGRIAALRLPGVPLTPVLVHLTTEPAGVLNLPSELRIAAGTTTEIPIEAQVIDDGRTNANRQVQLTASADGFGSTGGYLTVVDDELHHLAVTPTAGSRLIGTNEFEVTAHNVSGDRLDAYAGQVRLEWAEADGSGGVRPSGPAVEGVFTAGQWRGALVLTDERTNVLVLASTPEGFTARGEPFDAIDYTALPLGAHELVTDLTHGNLIASIPVATDQFPSGIAAIDPERAIVTRRITLEDSPGPMAVSRDGSSLYVASVESGIVQKLRLDDGAVERRWDLRQALADQTEIGGVSQLRVAQLAVVTDRPRAFLATLRDPWLPRPRAVVMIDEDQERPHGIATAGFLPDAASSSDPRTPSRTYLFAGQTVLLTRTDDPGLRLERILSGAPISPEFDAGFQVTLADGLAYSSSGAILEPERFEMLAPSPVAGAVIRDRTVGRLHYLTAEPSDNAVVSLDRSTLAPVARLRLPQEIRGLSRRFLRWGAHGLALLDWNGTVGLLRSRLLVPPRVSTDLGLAVRQPPGDLPVGEAIPFTVTITNRGPREATDVVLEYVLPPDASIDSTVIPPERASVASGIAHFRSGPLPVDGERTVEFTVRLRTLGPTLHRFRVLGSDLKTEDDEITIEHQAILGLQPPPVARLWQDGGPMVYSPGNDRLYLSDEAPETKEPRLWSVDPKTGRREGPIPVPSRLLRLAVTDDGQFLYGSADLGPSSGWSRVFEGRIFRLRLPDGAVDREFPVVDSLNQQHEVLDLLTLPGRPRDVLVARSGAQNDVALYEDGRSAARSPVSLYLRQLTRSPEAADQFFAYSARDHTVSWLRVEPSRIAVIHQGIVPVSGAGYDIWAAGGRVYTSPGPVLVPITMAQVADTGGGAIAATDPARDLVLFLRSESNRWRLRAVRASTSKSLWFHDLPDAFDAPRSFVSCGRGVFALLTNDGRLFFLDTRRLPGTPVADLAVRQEAPRLEITAGPRPEVLFRIVVTNRGPDVASDTVIANLLPTGANLVDSSVPVHPDPNDPNQARITLGNLEPNASARIDLRVRPSAPGPLTNIVTVASRAMDPDTSNDRHRAVAVIPVPLGDGWVLDGVQGQDLVFNPSRHLLHVSSSGSGPGEDFLLAVDPATGLVVDSRPLNGHPSRLGLSGDGRYLHVLLDGGRSIDRLDLVSGAVDLRWTFANGGSASTFVVSPTDPDLVAVVLRQATGWYQGVQLFRRGIALPRFAGAPVWADSLAFGSDGSVLYGGNGETSSYDLHRFSIGDLGIVATQSYPGVLSGWSRHIAQARGVIYASAGEIIEAATGRALGRFDIGVPRHPALTHLVALSPDAERAHFVVGSGNEAGLLTYRVSDQALLAGAGLPPFEGVATAIDTWSPDGLAMILGGKVFITRDPFVTGLTNGDVAVRVEAPETTPRPDGELTYTVTLTNRGPSRVKGLTTTIDFSPMAILARAETTHGTIGPGWNSAVWRVDSLEPGTEAVARISLSIQAPGLSFALARCASQSPDTVDADNFAFHYGAASGSTNGLLDLPVSDAVFVPSEGVAFVSLAAPHRAVIPLDPRTLGFESPIPLAGVAGPMALSIDGNRVYAGLPGLGIVEIDPRIRAASDPWALGTDGGGRPLAAVALAEVPGHPGRLAVAARSSEGTGPFRIAVFEGGEALPGEVSLEGVATVFTLAVSSTGEFLHLGTDSGYHRLPLGPDGLAPGSESDIRADLPGRFVLANERLYFESGAVLDAVSGSRIGTIPGPGSVAVDPTSARAYVLTGEPWSPVVKAVAAGTLTEEWERPFPALQTTAVRLLTAGRDHLLAWSNEGRAVVFDIAGQPQAALADLRVVEAIPTGWKVVGAVHPYPFRIDNLGPSSAGNVRLRLGLPAALEVVSVDVTQGTVQSTAEGPVVELGVLSSDRSATVTFHVRSTRVGAFPAELRLQSDVPDRDPANDSTWFEFRFGPPPEVSIAETSLRVATLRPGFAFVRVSLSGPSGFEIAVPVMAVDGTARAGVDYELTPTILTFRPGITNASLRIGLPHQPLPVPERFFSLVLGELTNARPARPEARIGIVDDRGPTIAVSDISRPEGDDAAAAMPFRVTLSAAHNLPVRVAYRTVDRSARAGIDFRPSLGSLVFAPGVTEIEVPVDVFGNRRRQPDRDFHLVLGDAENASLGSGLAAGYILDDDEATEPPTVLLESVSLAEDGLRLRFRAPTGYDYQVEASDRLTPESWLPISPIRPGDGSIAEFLDESIDSHTHRFYRLRLLP